MAYATNHSPVYMHVNRSCNTPGRNYWKFPTYLLHCNEFKDQLRNHIPIIIGQYKGTCSPSILWDLVKNHIWSFCMAYICNKRILKQKKIEDFEARLASKSAELLTLSGEDYHNCCEERNKLIESFDNVFKSNWKDYFIGRMVHCKEKSSKWFFKRISCIAGSIEMLYNEEGEEITDDKGILDICCSFYEKLFTNQQVQECNDAATSIYDDSIGNISFSDSISTFPYSDTEVREEVHDEPYAFLPDESSLRLSAGDHKQLGTEITLEEF